VVGQRTYFALPVTPSGCILGHGQEQTLGCFWVSGVCVVSEFWRYGDFRDDGCIGGSDVDVYYLWVFIMVPSLCSFGIPDRGEGSGGEVTYLIPNSREGFEFDLRDIDQKCAAQHNCDKAYSPCQGPL